MKKIERGEVMGLADYETIRDRFRARVIEEKKRRRFALGPHASGVFENRDTVLLQIQEMLRAERITREAAVLHEIETYNQFIPGSDELSATVMLEIDDKDTRDRFLVDAKGLDRSFYLVVDGEKFGGRHDVERESPDRTTAVHYLKFPMSELATRAVASGATKSVILGVDHPLYKAETVLGAAVLKSLADDFLEPGASP